MKKSDIVISAGVKKRLLSDLSTTIQKAMDEREAELDFKGLDVIRELAKIGFANMMDYLTIDEEGQPHVDLTMLTRAQAAAIQEIRYNAQGNLKFKLADKRAALADIGRHFALFTDRVENDLKIEGIEVTFVQPGNKA